MSPFFSSQNYKRDYGGGRRELTLCMRSGKGSYVPMLNLTDKIAGLCLRRELPFLFGNTIGSSSLVDSQHYSV